MRNRWRKLGLLGHFSVVSLVLIVALGVALAATLRSQIDDRALRNAEESAEQVARIGIQPQLSPTDLERGIAPARLRDLDAAVREDLSTGNLAGLRVWNRDGRVVYADEGTLVGQQLEPSEGLLTALSGTTSSHKEAAEEAKEEGGASTFTGELLEVYVPLTFPGETKPAGAFEIYLPYAPVAATISDDTRSLYLVLLGGLVLLYLGLFRVVAGASKRLRRHAAHNEHQALHDALTGLPNRTLFHDRIEQALRQSRRERVLGAVLLIDLDRFKEVNDTLGHQKGDLLLKDIGARLGATLRDSDTIARLGGDEFGVLLPDARTARPAPWRPPRRSAARLEADFHIDGLPVHVDASVGIALYPQHGEDVDTLLQHADVAMYEAKRTHGGHEIYSVEHDPYNPVRLAMVGQLRKGPRGQRGRCSTTSRRSTWRPAGSWAPRRSCAGSIRTRGLILPAEFVPMAERTGLIRPLSRYVLDHGARAVPRVARRRARPEDLGQPVGAQPARPDAPRGRDEAPDASGGSRWTSSSSRSPRARS